MYVKVFHNLLLSFYARGGTFSFPMWLFPPFVILFGVLGEKGVVIHDYETFLLFREQCDLSKRLICAKK